MDSSQDGARSIYNTAEEQSSEPQDRAKQTTQHEVRGGKRGQKEQGSVPRRDAPAVGGGEQRLTPTHPKQQADGKTSPRLIIIKLLETSEKQKIVKAFL